MGDEEVQALLVERAIRRVEPDVETALEELAAARRHVESAAEIAELDPIGAFSLAYDAARKAIAAHMRARGYRIGSGPGGHANTGRYALAALDHLDVGGHIDAFDDMRRLRNQSGYDALMVEEDDVEAALDHSRAIVEAIEQDLA